MSTDNALGQFLRARRQRTRPEDVGLPLGHGQRRVPGLRREEVAMLAGVSSDYYLRLEQGRDSNPSAQVLDALARVLQLDEYAAQHLQQLTPGRADPARLAELVLGHWSVETLHHARGVTYTEVASKIRTRKRAPGHVHPAQPRHRLTRQPCADDRDACALSGYDSGMYVPDMQRRFPR
jgi:transcriptional regulator with XRE-family HTH domain